MLENYEAKKEKRLSIFYNELGNMSKKKVYNKHLEKGKLYSVNKHPGLIIYKNDKKNTYIAVVTVTSPGRHKTRLSIPTEPNLKRSFVNNRPVLGKRKHFGSHELVGMKIDSADRKTIEIIKRRKPVKIKKIRLSLFSSA